MRVATATSAQIVTVITMADAAELRRSAGCTATTLWNSIVASSYFGGQSSKILYQTKEFFMGKNFFVTLETVPPHNEDKDDDNDFH